MVLGSFLCCVLLGSPLVIRDSSPSFKVELLRDRMLVSPEDVLAVMLMVVGVSPGHGYSVVLESVILQVGGYGVLGAVIGWRWFAGGKVW